MDLRSRINDLGWELDRERASVAASMGGGVFLALLSALAAYDLYSGNAGLWSAVGVTSDLLKWVAVLLGAAGLALIARGIAARRHGKSGRQSLLEDLERQYAELLEYKESIDGGSGED
jgi:hypothetical protein